MPIFKNIYKCVKYPSGSACLWVVNFIFVWHSVGMCPHGWWLMLFQEMACCLTAPNHYLNNIDLVSDKPLRTYVNEISIKTTKKLIQENALKNVVCRLSSILLRSGCVMLWMIDETIHPRCLVLRIPHWSSPWLVNHHKYTVTDDWASNKLDS